MTSYRQRTTPTTVGEAIKDAERAVSELGAEMAELCASIAAQFPNTYEKITKYQEAVRAHTALDIAVTLLKAVEITREHQGAAITVVVGRQTRPHRGTSQRVRLGNAIVRVVSAGLRLIELTQDDDGAVDTLNEIVEAVSEVTFPKTYG